MNKNLYQFKLKDFVDDFGDGIHGTPNYDSDGDYYFINGNNLLNGRIALSENTKRISKTEYDRIKRNLTENSILVSINGSLGNLAYYCGEKVALGKSACFVNIKNCDDKEFIRYVLETKSFKNYISRVSTGSTIKNLSPTQLVEYSFLAPSKEKHSQIGGFLSLLDRKIENNAKQIETLESIAKTIYDYWFVQFDFPNEDGKPYKSSGGKMVWNEELKREIPESWMSSNIGSFVSEQISGDWGKESVEGNYTKEVFCIRGTDLSSLLSGLLTAPTRYILEKNSGLKLKNGDVIVEISGGSPTQSTGRISYVNENALKRGNCDLIASNFCKVLRLKSCSLLYFFYCSWDDIYSRGIFYRYEGKTTGIKNLMLDMFLDSYRLAIPSNEALFIKFDLIVTPIFEKIQKLNLESEKLHSIKDFLLPLLMNGQVTLQ